jgi:glyoxylate reductase
MSKLKDTVVILTRRLPETVERRMVELFDASLNKTDKPFSHDDLIKAVKKADVLVTTITDTIDADVIRSAGPKLKLIANFGVGVDHIDLIAAKKKGIMVTNTPSVLTEDTADMAMALMLAVPRRLHEGERLARSGKWKGWAPTQMLGTRISGKKLGILGMGRIGRAVARRAKGFGLAVHYHNRKRLHPSIELELNATYHATLDAMLPEIDILSIHCPYTRDTHHLMDAKRLKRMKPTSYLINTARGAIIDERALIKALEKEQLAGAGLDVYENEPLIAPELIALENVVLVPHMCSATHEARTEMGEKVLINITCFFDGHRPPPDRVLLEEAS